jgi:hypothetical protein
MYVPGLVPLASRPPKAVVHSGVVQSPFERTKPGGSPIDSYGAGPVALGGRDLR